VTPRASTRRCRGDEGNALVEFTYLSVLLMVPLVYVLILVFLVQRAAFGTTEAARQAGRAYARASTVDEAEQRAAAAAGLALKDQGIANPGAPTYRCLGGPCLAPGSRVQVTLTYRVRLPLLGSLFGNGSGGTIPVTATHTEYVDAYKAP
jgi:Flp pilus assembly protein TadG